MGKFVSSSNLSRSIILTLVFVLLFAFIQPATFDAIFILYFEAFLMCFFVLIISFVAKDFLDGLMQVLVSSFLIPILLFFILCGFFLTLLIFTGGGPEQAGNTGEPLIEICWRFIDQPWQTISDIRQYFGSDLIWIFLGILIYQFISVVAIKQYKNLDFNAVWFGLKKQLMLQSIALLLASLLGSVILSAGINFFSENIWFTYLLIILFRILVEFWKFYLENSARANNS